ncbi:NADH-quinone oxidoreductase subunit L [Janibacter sp. G1551]|uniref:NADH-quinone oxidoreductase subunit 5 family protein n=1 Tax=Janibacter sp. G1551 TaxID=3420440 RepID=UPI003D064DFF
MTDNGLLDVVAPGVVGLPLVAAVLGLALARRRVLAAVLANLSAGVLVVLTWILAVEAPRGIDAAAAAMGWRTPAQWTGGPGGFTAGDVQLPLDLVVSGPSALVALVVAAVALAVQLYATWYLASDDRYGTFAATVSLFAGAMHLLVLSSDLALTLIGWEVMGWCSYLLIGHWSRKATARRAAHKAFLVTRFADIAFVLGIVTLVAGAGSTRYGDVVAHWAPVIGADARDVPVAAGSHAVLTTAMVLLVIGILGKSAQFPFQDWLPDAMEGPTPASALIHAATMVAAGTFVLAQLAQLLDAAPVAGTVLGVSVGITMIGAALLALGQSDLKRMLAWSTVSQIAIMLAPLAVAAPHAASGAALFHLYGHALFKSLLFLAVGWLGLIGGGTSARALAGTGRVHPAAMTAWALGLISLAGVPFFVGGLSKEHVVEVVGHESDPLARGLLLALLITVVLTAAYATRALLVVALPTGAREQTRAVAAPVAIGVLLVLSALTVLGGLVMATDLIPLDLSPASDILLVAGLVVVGAAFAWLTAARRGTPIVAPGLLATRADAGLGVDRLYRAAIATPVLALARLVAWVDTEVVDAWVRGAAAGVRTLGAVGHRAHATERSSTGLVAVALGLVVLVGLGVVAWL